MSSGANVSRTRPASVPTGDPAVADRLPLHWTFRVLGFAALALALIGAGISAYLLVVHIQGQSPVCRIAHGCATVQKSEYSKIMGVPISVPGIAGYVALGGLAVVWLTGWRGLRAHAALFAFYASLFGILFSAYLTYVEWRVLEAWCIWCIGSAITMTLLFAAWVALFAREMRARQQ